MSKEDKSKLNLRIPIIKADSEAQTSGHLVVLTPDKESQDDKEDKEENNLKTEENMDTTSGQQNLRKRRNLSKNRGQATRQREKTPEPGRMGAPHEDTTTSDEEETPPKPKTTREIEAEDNYKEMMRMVHEKSSAKDPDDLDQDEIIKAREFAANERRRRSISPFAIPDKEELAKLQRKGSFVDPGNKLLSTTYILSPKEEDSERRNSLTIESPVKRNSPSPSTPTSGSPREGAVFPFPSPPSPRKQKQMIYSDEAENREPGRTVLTPVKKEFDVFTFDDIDTIQKSKPKTPVLTKQEQPIGGLVTKVITVERSPSKKLTADNKPVVEVRPTAVERTPSKKSLSESRPVVVRRSSTRISREGTQEPPSSRPPPVKPARSKSASRFGGKTSESEMSEDQSKFLKEIAPIAVKRKNVPTPRRFLRNRSPKGARSQSVARVEDLSDKTSTGMSQTSREIIELLEKSRARSLSIPKDDQRLPSAYRKQETKNKRTLATPNKSPASRSSRGISCPKTIQLISSNEVLAGLTKVQKLDLEFEKHRKSRYIDASQSEYTSSCYSSSPSENDYDFKLDNTIATAELNRKLSLLSQELDMKDGILFNNTPLDTEVKIKKRSVGIPHDKQFENVKESIKQCDIRRSKEEIKKVDEKKRDYLPAPSKYKILNIRRNWRIFVNTHNKEYDSLVLLINRCICDLMLLIIFCGLGGMIFKNLEGSFESAFKCGSRNVKRDFIENLWKGSHYLREDDWKAMARNKLHEFEDQLHTAHEAGVTSHSGQRSWNFMNSFVYCLTIVTTIGYGHIVPTTFYGRVATILYAVIGIPLFLIVLADFGKLFTRIIKFFWAFIRRLYYTGSCKKVRKTVPMQEMMRGFNMVYDVVRRPSQMMFEEDLNAVRRPSEQREGVPVEPEPERKETDDVPPPLPPKPGQQPTWVVGGPDIETGTETPAPSVFEIDDEFNLPISVAIVILILYILVGAVVYMTWEEWTFFQSFYFVFISMSTIGFGDLVPGHPIYMMTSILYLVFGLALTSMCINVVQVKLSDTFKQASAKIGATIGLRVAEDDGGLVPNTSSADLAPVHKPKPKVDAKESKNDDVDAEIVDAMKNE